MDVYDRINELLAEKKIRKRKLCIDLNIPYTTLASMFQRRSKSIDIETLKKIASYLDTTLEYLATGNEKYKHLSLAPTNTVTIVTSNNQTYVYNLANDELNAIMTILNNMEQQQWEQ